MLGARPAATSRCEPSSALAALEIDGDAGGVALDARDPVVRAQGDAFGSAGAATTMAASSGSSLAQEVGDLEHGDPAPSRRCACAISRPIGPPPITIRWPGRVRLAKIVSLVR